VINMGYYAKIAYLCHIEQYPFILSLTV